MSIEAKVIVVLNSSSSNKFDIFLPNGFFHLAVFIISLRNNQVDVHSVTVIPLENDSFMFLYRLGRHFHLGGVASVSSGFHDG